MSAPTRRSVVAGAAVLPALAIPAAATGDDAQIERLWIERTRIATEMQALAREQPEEDANEALVTRITEIEDAIDQTAASPTKIAAIFMIELQSGRVNVGLEKDDVCLLSVLRPSLTGLIALHVDDLIRRPSIPIKEREFCEA